MPLLTLPGERGGALSAGTEDSEVQPSHRPPWRHGEEAASHLLLLDPSRHEVRHGKPRGSDERCISGRRYKTINPENGGRQDFTEALSLCLIVPPPPPATPPSLSPRALSQIPPPQLRLRPSERPVRRPSKVWLLLRRALRHLTAVDARLELSQGQGAVRRQCSHRQARLLPIEPDLLHVRCRGECCIFGRGRVSALQLIAKTNVETLAAWP